MSIDYGIHRLQNLKGFLLVNIATQFEKKGALLKVPDLAELLGMSVSTIYRKRSLGEPLPKAIKINSSVRWTRESVEEFLAEHAE